MSGGGALLSIVVPTFNSQATLARALSSLAAQTERDFEVIVSDGASRDATLHIAHEHAPALPALRVDSRPDGGVYDAINRAIALARGQWVLVLGSDDRLHAADTLALIAPALREATADLLHGDVIVTGPSHLGVPPGERYAGPMPLARLCTVNLCQQAIFYRRSLFAELGGFKLEYRLWADWEFNLRAGFRAPMQWVDVVVADYATSGMSSAAKDSAFEDERLELVRREFACRPFERRLWPAQRRLLSQANALRKRGRWHAMARQLGSYFALLACRPFAPRERQRAHAS
jgi:glycosyltransferase involved in cell wall biosynthesis